MSENEAGDAVVAERSIEQRVEHFRQNIDEYIHIGELIVGTRRTDKGIACLVSDAHRSELEVSMARIIYEVNKRISYMEFIHEQSKQGKILTPGNGKGGMFNFIRGRKK